MCTPLESVCEEVKNKGNHFLTGRVSLSRLRKSEKQEAGTKDSEDD